ncbi:hypothetical protein BKA82DRAFT_4194546 [Pisolithus tinctorius]|nr:hypothetical protein BKA82DRAFT_4194546 [Pisolithus tinctorius]
MPVPFALAMPYKWVSRRGIRLIEGSFLISEPSEDLVVIRMCKPSSVRMNCCPRFPIGLRPLLMDCSPGLFRGPHVPQSYQTLLMKPRRTWGRYPSHSIALRSSLEGGTIVKGRTEIVTLLARWHYCHIQTSRGIRNNCADRAHQLCLRCQQHQTTTRYPCPIIQMRELSFLYNSFPLWSRFKPLRPVFPPDILPKETWDLSAAALAPSSLLPARRSGTYMRQIRGRDCQDHLASAHGIVNISGTTLITCGACDLQLKRESF